MIDLTAGRSAGSRLNAELDPTRPTPPAHAGDPRDDATLVDVMAGRSAGTDWNAAQDPTRPVSPDDPRR